MSPRERCIFPDSRQMSPAWAMSSQRFRRAAASGRTWLCVSERTPMRDDWLEGRHATPEGFSRQGVWSRKRLELSHQRFDLPFLDAVRIVGRMRDETNRIGTERDLHGHIANARNLVAVTIHLR